MRPTATTGTERGHRPRGPEDYEGYEVYDPLGQRIGRLEKLFVDGDGDPKHLRVRLGFLGKSVLIPVEGLGTDRERRTVVLGTPRRTAGASRAKPSPGGGQNVRHRSEREG